jgi:hypothetical protein
MTLTSSEYLMALTAMFCAGGLATLIGVAVICSVAAACDRRHQEKIDGLTSTGPGQRENDNG